MISRSTCVCVFVSMIRNSGVWVSLQAIDERVRIYAEDTAKISA